MSRISDIAQDPNFAPPNGFIVDPLIDRYYSESWGGADVRSVRLDSGDDVMAVAIGGSSEDDNVYIVSPKYGTNAPIHVGVGSPFIGHLTGPIDMFLADTAMVREQSSGKNTDRILEVLFYRNIPKWLPTKRAPLRESYVLPAAGFTYAVAPNGPMRRPPYYLTGGNIAPRPGLCIIGRKRIRVFATGTIGNVINFYWAFSDPGTAGGSGQGAVMQAQQGTATFAGNRNLVREFTPNDPVWTTGAQWFYVEFVTTGGDCVIEAYDD